MLRAGQEQERLLQVGSQVEQVHDLGDPGPTDVPQFRQRRVVLDLALPDLIIKVQGQGHQAGDARDTPCLQRPRGWRSGLEFLASPVAAPVPVEVTFDRQRGHRFPPCWYWASS